MSMTFITLIIPNGSLGERWALSIHSTFPYFGIFSPNHITLPIPKIQKKRLASSSSIRAFYVPTFSAPLFYFSCHWNQKARLWGWRWIDTLSPLLGIWLRFYSYSISPSEKTTFKVIPNLPFMIFLLLGPAEMFSLSKLISSPIAWSSFGRKMDYCVDAKNYWRKHNAQVTEKGAIKRKKGKLRTSHLGKQILYLYRKWWIDYSIPRRLSWSAGLRNPGWSGSEIRDGKLRQVIQKAKRSKYADLGWVSYLITMGLKFNCFVTRWMNLMEVSRF